MRVTSPRVPFSTLASPGVAVLCGERDQVAFAQPVVLVGQRSLVLAEFAALGPECWARAFSRSISTFEASAIRATSRISWCLGQLGPALDGGLAGLLARVGEEQLAAGLVVRHRPLGLPGAQRGPRLALVGVAGATDFSELRRGSVEREAVEHAAGSDRGELLAVTDRDQLRPRALDQAR